MCFLHSLSLIIGGAFDRAICLVVTLVVEHECATCGRNTRLIIIQGRDRRMKLSREDECGWFGSVACER